MHARFIVRVDEGLKKLQSAAESGRLKDETTAHRRLGRLQGQNSRAAKAFDVVIELAKIKTGDVVLPVQNRDGSAPRTVRLRCVTEPDADQKLLLHRLGLTLPRRLQSTEDLPLM